MLLIWIDTIALEWRRYQDRRQIRRDERARQERLLRYLGRSGAVR